MLKHILDWLEVWALSIPILFIRFNKKYPSYIKPIILYLFISLAVNTVIDLIAGQKDLHISLPWKNNNPLYNIHSIYRFYCFAAFFLLLKTPASRWFIRILIIVFTVFVFINFIRFEKFVEKDVFSSYLLAMETFLLLSLCIQYYLSKLKNDPDATGTHPDFWIVTGLSIYIVFNFFHFLFYTTLSAKGYNTFGLTLWYIHNITYLVLCLFLSKAIYEVNRSGSMRT